MASKLIFLIDNWWEEARVDVMENWGWDNMGFGTSAHDGVHHIRTWSELSSIWWVKAWRVLSLVPGDYSAVDSYLSVMYPLSSGDCG